MDEIRGVPLIKRIATAVERDVNNRVRSQGATISQIQLLLRLETAGGLLPYKELERRLDVSQAAVAGLVKRLKEKGFVEVITDSEDKRIKHAQITPKGLQTCGDAHEHMDAIEQTLVSGLTDIEAKMFLELLRKIDRNIS